MEIVFLRHGETDLNKSYQIQGALVDQSLNEAGRAYAEKAARNFTAADFAAVYASPFKRAQETAEIFVKGQKEILLDERLREQDFGEWDSTSVQLHLDQNPDAFDDWGFISDEYQKYAPHGETHQQVVKRVKPFLDELISKYPNQKILVVCHGTLIRSIVAYFLQTDRRLIAQLDNCALAKFDLRASGARLVYYNKKLA